MTGGIAPQLSVAVAVPVTAGSVGVPQGSVKSGGQVIAGAVVSWTVIVCVQMLALPHGSSSLVGAGDHVVARRAAAVDVAHVRDGHVAEQLSVPVTEARFAGGIANCTATVTLPGQLTTSAASCRGP